MAVLNYEFRDKPLPHGLDDTIIKTKSGKKVPRDKKGLELFTMITQKRSYKIDQTYNIIIITNQKRLKNMNYAMILSIKLMQ